MVQARARTADIFPVLGSGFYLRGFVAPLSMGMLCLLRLVDKIKKLAFCAEFFIFKILNLVNNAKLARLADAYTVDDGITSLQLRLKGLFDSEADTFSTKKHSVESASSSTSGANKLFEKSSACNQAGQLKKAGDYRSL